MARRRVTLSREMVDTSYRFGVVPKAGYAECSSCGGWPTATGHPNFPQLWLFTSRKAATHFRATSECQTCQDGDDYG